MGYWDKKEPKKEEQKQQGKIECNNINEDAIDQLETDMLETQREVLETVEGIAESIKKQKLHAQDLLSSNYWIGVCFNNQTQKEQFLSALGYDPLDTFVDGHDFAKKVHVDIKEPNHDYSRERRVVKAYQDRALSLDK